MDALLELEKQIYGEASMQWQRKKPMMQVCSICGKATGLNVSSLEKHMERLHLSVKQGEGERVNNNDQIM
jgi:atypical dual specificity phosphatase